MKKFKVFLIMCFCVTLVFSLLGCGKDKNQVALYKDLDSSLEKYFDYKEGSTFEEEKNNQINRADEQINALKKYQSMDFEDKGIKDVLNTYIKALETRKEGFEKYYATTDNKKIQEYIVDKGKRKMGESIDELINNHKYKPVEKIKNGISDYFGSDLNYIPIGEKFKVVTSNNGSYYITFRNIVKSNWEYMISELNDGKTISLLILDLENIDYNDEFNPHLIELGDYIHIFDKNAYNLSIPDETSDYSGYEVATGGVVIKDRIKGKTKVAIPFVHDVGDDLFLITTDNTGTFMKLNN